MDKIYSLIYILKIYNFYNLSCQNILIFMISNIEKDLFLQYMISKYTYFYDLCYRNIPIFYTMFDYVNK